MAGAVARASTRTRKKTARAQDDDERDGSNPPSQPSAPASTSASGASASASASRSRSTSRNGTVDLASDADAPLVAAVASSSNKRRVLPDTLFELWDAKAPIADIPHLVLLPFLLSFPSLSLDSGSSSTSTTVDSRLVPCPRAQSPASPLPGASLKSATNDGVAFAF